MMTLLSVMKVMPVVPWGREAADPSLLDSPEGARAWRERIPCHFCGKPVASLVPQMVKNLPAVQETPV